MRSPTLLLLLPLLAHALPRGCEADDASESVLQSASLTDAQALVADATGSAARSHRHHHTTTEVAQTTATDTNDDGEGESVTNTSQAISTEGSTRSQVATLTASATRTTSPAGATATGVSTPSPDADDCKCGYILSSYSNTYFPKSLILDFASIADGTSLSSLGFDVTTDETVGGAASDGTRCVGTADNVVISDGLLQLTMPGGQSGSDLTCAEIASSDQMTGGVLTMETEVSDVSGACQAFFTYTAGSSGDEQDIEMLADSFTTSAANGTPAGIQLTNWDPSGSGKSSNDIVPFPADPSAGYHNYTIGWLPDSTIYSFDGAVLSTQTEYVSINPSRLLMNVWSNGSPGFTSGPPTSDVTMKVKSLRFYYMTSEGASYPSGCSEADACTI